MEPKIMTLNGYVQYFAANEAFFGSNEGWYAVEVTDCDTIVSGDHDGSNVMPFASRESAQSWLDHYVRF